jgi:hypothetical protein
MRPGEAELHGDGERIEHDEDTSRAAQLSTN